MTPLPADVEVCLPGRGCTYYVPGAGQAVNAAIALGPRAVDAWLAAALIALAAVAVILMLVAPLSRLRLRSGERTAEATPAIASALLIASGAIAAVPPFVPAAAPVAEAFELTSSTCIGVAFLVLAARLPPAPSVALIAVAVTRLLVLPCAVAQVLAGAPLGLRPSELVDLLGALVLTLGGLVLLVTGRGLGVLGGPMLLPPLAGLLAAVRLALLPFPVGPWIDLLPDVAIAVVGVAVLVARPVSASGAPDRRRTALRSGGAVAALAVTLAVLFALPAPGVGAPAAGEPSIGPIRTVDASARIELPLDGYQQSPAGQRAVIDAENTLIEACGARRGIAVQAADLLPAPTVESNASLLGLIDARQAATSGYWAPPPAEASGHPEDDRTLRILSGCVRTARARLGDDDGPQGVVRNAVYDALKRADADSRARRVTAAWSRCMQQRGFVATEPEEVMPWTEESTFPTPQDTRTASADVVCRGVTDLPGIRAALLAAYEKRVLAERAAKLIGARARLDAEARLAASILRPAADEGTAGRWSRRTAPGRDVQASADVAFVTDAVSRRIVG